MTWFILYFVKFRMHGGFNVGNGNASFSNSMSDMIQNMQRLTQLGGEGSQAELMSLAQNIQKVSKI